MAKKEKELLSGKLERVLLDSLKEIECGEKIPSERKLAEKHGVSRITVRDAIAKLENMGFLLRQVGRGTYVTGRHIEKLLVNILSCDFSHDELSEVVESINAENSKYKIDGEFHPEFNYESTEKLTISLADSIKNNSRSKIISVNEGNIATLASQGALEPLDGLIANSKIIKKNIFFQRLLKQYIVDGKIYGLPVCWSAPVLVYNKNIFKDYGISFPDNSWTWMDVQKACDIFNCPSEKQKLVKPLILDMLNSSFLSTIFWQRGVRLFNEKKESNADKKEFLETVKFFDEMIHSHGAMPYMYENSFTTPFLFANDKIAMITLFHALVHKATDGKKRSEWGAVSLPGWKCNATRLPSQGFALTKSTDTTEAFQILEDFFDPKNVTKIAAATKRFPALESLKNEIPEFLLKQLDTKQLENEIPGKYRFYPPIRDELFMVWNKLEKPEQACKNIREKIEARKKEKFRT